MRWERLEPVANAVLYEGFLLYPYRRSSLKNQRYWGLGGLLAGARLSAETLLRGNRRASIEVRLRFLQLEGADPLERAVDFGPFGLDGLASASRDESFGFEPHVRGRAAFRAEAQADDVWKVRVEIQNDSETASDHSTLHAAHLLIGTEGGAFVSLIDPPPGLEALAHGCRNVGVWPVLGGEPGSSDLLLCSPIVLYDYPSLAPESGGDLFDSTEIDEILTLRILTLSDDEKRELSRGDPRAGEILARAESAGATQLERLHGATRRLAINGHPVACHVRVGDRVTLRPRRRSDVMDLALANRAAIVASIEQDFEGRVQIAVVVEDDPGAHRFFFQLDEIETNAERTAP